ncbi:Kinesin-associated protein 3 [Perkinsus chesapeaki]|uniref:Kinesin-associated protein 3 n=1 Tax=Perkinsus chesapeaki TaxID=330153 RepID=A0A7J6MM18_PERCH|nr:Kinesin-associated protein 3 [Perkinsus chesapeaki]
MSRTVRKIRPNGLEANLEEGTIIINYTQEVSTMDDQDRVTSVESQPGKKTVRLREVGTNVEGKADQVMQAANKYILPKQRDELIRLLTALKAHQSALDRPRSTTRRPSSVRRQDRSLAEESPKSYYEAIFSLLPADVSPNATEKYKDMLYEDAPEEKLIGARCFLRLCVDPRTFDYVCKEAMATGGEQGGFNCTWLSVLARVLREESMGLFDLPTAISSCFLCMSTCTSLHPLMSASQCGGVTLKLVDHEVQERARVLRQGVEECRAAQDQAGLAREERKVMKQNKLLRIALLTLLHLAEDATVERKMVNGKLPSLIVRLLDRTWEPLLKVCLVFMKKLSVFREAKDQMVEAGVLRPLVANCVLQYKSSPVGVLALHVLYNLSFDPGVRDALSESGVITTLVTVLREQPNCRQLVLRLLYQFSFDDRCKSQLCFCQDFIPMLIQLVVGFPEPRVGLDLMAVMVNLSVHQRSSRLMLDSGLWPDLVHRAIKFRDPLVLKVMRNVSSHGQELQERFCDVMNSTALSHWAAELVRMARRCGKAGGKEEKADGAAEIVVENPKILGMLANFTCPGTVDWGELCSMDDNGFLLDLLTQQLIPGFTGDDVLLQSIMVAGVVAASSDTEVGTRLCESPLLLRRLVDLLTAKQEDDEIVLQLLWTFTVLLSNSETAEVVLEDQDGQVVHYILDLVRDDNPMIARQAMEALGVVGHLERERSKTLADKEASTRSYSMFEKVRRARFEAYNNDWIGGSDRGGAGESIYYGTEGSGEEGSTVSDYGEAMPLFHHNVAFVGADMLHDRLWQDYVEGDDSESLGSSSEGEHVTYETSLLPLSQHYKTVVLEKGRMTKLPPAITLNRQRYRHVDHCEWMNTEEIKSFVQYWQFDKEMLQQRCGWLYGYYLSDPNYDDGYRVVVEGIYEPPKQEVYNAASGGVRMNEMLVEMQEIVTWEGYTVARKEERDSKYAGKLIHTWGADGSSL